MGIPTYAAAGPWWGHSYHNPAVETPRNALAGVHAGLQASSEGGTLPDNFAGVAIYSEWETSPEEWELFKGSYARPGAAPENPVQ